MLALLLLATAAAARVELPAGADAPAATDLPVEARGWDELDEAARQTVIRALEPPTFTPGPGYFTTPTLVTLQSVTPQTMRIFYTTDGSLPTEHSQSVFPGDSIAFQTTTTVVARAAFDYVPHRETERQFFLSDPVNATYQIETGKIGFAFLTPYHHGPGYSGKVVSVDLRTAIYKGKQFEIKDVTTDFADFLSSGGTTPHDGQVKLLDLAAAASGLKGFQGGFIGNSTRTYGFMVPFFDGADFTGLLARVDLDGYLHSNATVHCAGLSRDAESLLVNEDTDGCRGAFPVLDTLDLAAEVDDELRGFVGGVAHQGYAYLAPNRFGKLPRVPVDGDLDAADVEVLDLGAIDSDLAGGFHGAFAFDGYVYLVPARNSRGPVGGANSKMRVDADQLTPNYASKLVRIDVSDFSASGVTVLPLEHAGFAGGFVAGKYGVLVPYQDNEDYGYHGNIVRIDLDTFTAAGALDLTQAHSELRGFVGGCASGRYAFLAPYKHGMPDTNFRQRDTSGRIARIDLADFSLDAVDSLDLSVTLRKQIPEMADHGLRGFTGALCAGDFLYLVPSYNGVRHGKLVRVHLDYFTDAESSDTLNEGVQIIDLSLVDGDLVGFSGGFVNV